MIRLDNISGRLNPPNSDSVYVCEQNSIAIEKNEYIAIVGESGSGKSQFVKILSGLNEDYFQLTDGALNFYFNENDQFTFDSDSQIENIPYSDIKLNFRSKKIYGSKIGMMFQNPSTCFNPYWTVDRHFDEIKRIYQVADTAGVGFDKFKFRIIQKLFKETQSDEEMKDFLEKKPNQLSGGQKQRLVIALVIIRSPDLIIGDEIGTGIDLKIKKDIHDLLQGC